MHVSVDLLPAAVGLVLIFYVSSVEGISAAVKNFVRRGEKPAAFKAPSPNTISPNVLPLTRKSGSRSAAYLASIRKGNQVDGVYGFAPLASDVQGHVFLADVKFGSQSFQVIVNNGSSDTWLIKTRFQCWDSATLVPEPENYCTFGPTYNISTTFQHIPDENFQISHVDGEILGGIIGTEATLAGITVKNRQVGVVDLAAWYGDGRSSGLVGLSFPVLTHAYRGTDPTLHSNAARVVYNPVFTNMYSEGHVAPLFSLAIDRGTSSGVMAIGGLPLITFFPVFASTPFQLLTISNAFGTTGQIDCVPQYQFYAITADGFDYEGNETTKWTYGNWANPLEKPSVPSKLQIIVDSGTTLIYLLTAIANAVNALFVPPPIYNSTIGAYVVVCSAKAPRFGVTVGKQTFYINGLDMILFSGPGTCESGVSGAGLIGFSILGDVFFKNVLAVFDVGASEMRFAAMKIY